MLHDVEVVSMLYGRGCPNFFSRSFRVVCRDLTRTWASLREIRHRITAVVWVLRSLGQLYPWTRQQQSIHSSTRDSSHSTGCSETMQLMFKSGITAVTVEPHILSIWMLSDRAISRTSIEGCRPRRWWSTKVSNTYNLILCMFAC